MKKYVMGSLKFLFVDSTVNILGDLFEQPLIMWAFIGWGWLCVLAIATSLFALLPEIVSTVYALLF
ncbi:MAG: hypothetical protein AAF525_09380 [Pseudomonadota bacterium]